MADDRLFKFILKCGRNKHMPDFHSFIIDVKCGKAFVDYREDGVFVETHINGNKTQFLGSAIAAANRLEAFGAIYETIDM